MDPVSSNMKAVSGGLNQAVQAGRELEKSINNVNSFMNEAVSQQAAQRAKERFRKRMAVVYREDKAFERLKEKKKIEEKRERMKQEILRTYGKDAWSQYQACLSEIEKEEKEEEKALDTDKAKLFELKVACVAAAFLVTYFGGLYKF